ncbi:MAG: SCP2 sterol-binding domain-containing protein [Acidimicrobiia bacterium]
MPATKQTGEPSTQGFFDELGAQHQPLLAKTTGTLRFDVTESDNLECWHITITNGDVVVSREVADADTIIRLEKSLFDEIVCGRANAMAAGLRGELALEGSPELVMRFQRLFPALVAGRTS